MHKENNEILKQISDTLVKINSRQEAEELFSDSNKILEKSDRRVENATNQIQNSFDRINDKVFNFNNIMIGVYLVLGSFPNKSPEIEIWSFIWPFIWPLMNLGFLIYFDYQQMEIYRFASREQQWRSIELEEYGTRIRKQTRLSLIVIISSLLYFVYIIKKLT